MVRSVMAVLALTIFPGLAAGQQLGQQVSRTHVVVDGDHLWGLASAYYNDPFQWRRIYDANLNVVEDPHWIFPDEELVIPGIPGPVVAVGPTPEPDLVQPEPAIVGPDLVQPEPAIVGDVAVVTPPDEAPPLVRTRPNLERERRSRFYRDPTAQSTTLATAAADFIWVSRASTWSAEWLGPATLEELEFDGRIESFVTEGDVRTAFPYTRVRLNLEPGFRASLGDALQIYRPIRISPEVGVVLHPTGVLSVTRVAPNAVEGLVLETFDRVRMGDFVRPAPVHDLVPGQYPDMVTNRTDATVIEFGEVHLVYGLRQVTILDKGSRDGVTIGDEYVTFFGDASAEEVTGRVRVVLTEEETSSAEIVTVLGPVFQVGTTVHLDRKMR